MPTVPSCELTRSTSGSVPQQRWRRTPHPHVTVGDRFFPDEAVTQPGRGP
jgi:hypothetical protein